MLRNKTQGENPMSELDKTIEELEAEVHAELEEAKAPGASGGKSDSMEKQEGEVEDLAKAVDDPESKESIGKKAAAKVSKAADPKPAQTKEEAELADDDAEEIVEGKMTKAEMLNAMYDEMKSMKAGDLKASYDKMMAKDEEEEKEESVDESTLDDRLASVDVSEDVTALTDGEELSEEFKEKASTIFEAAVKSKLRSEVERIEEAKVQEVAEEVNAVRDELTEKVDAYMNYVVEEWMKENEIAIERGLKGEIAEDFISGLKNLFTEHYIDVPEGKVDLVDDLSEQVAELEGNLNKSTEDNIRLHESVQVLERANVIRENSLGLAETEAEKLASLVEDIDFDNKETFEMKVKTVKESYFTKEVNEKADEVKSLIGNDSVETADISDSMARYTQAISKNYS